MRLEVLDATETNLQYLFDWPSTNQGLDAGCRSCLYWEHPAESDRLGLSLSERVAVKRRWFRQVTAEFGCCGKIALADSAAVGYAQFAPARYLLGARAYACGPPNDDAVLISCLYVHDQRGKGIGTALLSAICDDLRGRGVVGTETFARKSSANNCSGPLGFWLKNGYRIVREDADFALVRKELA